MRLTEKRPSNYYAFSKECPEPWTTNCVQKLGQLEDILDKYEIDDMQELDDRLSTYKFLANHDYSTMPREDLNSMIDKILSINKIEEELGIDLATLFKVLKNGLYSSFIDKENNKLVLKSLSLHLLETLDGFDCIFKDNDERVLFFKDYGKTWALTKEELL